MIENNLLSVDNGTDKVVPADATLVAREYYTSYGKYVLEYRALPSVYDGLKPVQRRIIFTANQLPMKLMKTAKMSGLVMQYHPHGNASIDGAINDMAHPLNALPLFVTKGNFGGVGFGASATRYTELYLSEIARQNFCQFIEYANYEVGEIGEEEPSELPTLIPYCLIRGSEGIGVGLSTKVMPLNLIDLIDYYVDFISRGGHSKRKVKPDVGYVLLEMTNKEIDDAVKKAKGRITVSSVVSQISSTSFLIESIYDRSIDAVINKIDRKTGWFSKDQVGFRDASTSSAKYIFEIYDTTSVTPTDLKNALIDATSRSGSYTRVLEEDGCAVYSSLDYIVTKSLECLNKAIDRKLVSENVKYQNQLDIYNVLDLCKNSGVFNNATKLTSDQLIDLIIKTTNCSRDIAENIIKKPISYLTKSHDREKQDLVNKLNDIKTHDRKSYLIKLYKDFRKLVLPIYENKSHSITRNLTISNPCIKIDASNKILVTDGDGSPFDSEVYFVSDLGVVYHRTLSTIVASEIILQTLHSNEKIVGVVTDRSDYIKIVTELDNKDYHGETIIRIDTLNYDKKYINFREDFNEKISRVEGLISLEDSDKSKVQGTRISRTSWVKNKN